MAKQNRTKGQTTQWPNETGQRTDNTMAKQNRTKGQTTQWPNETGQKDRQHNSQLKQDKRTDNT